MLVTLRPIRKTIRCGPGRRRGRGTARPTSALRHEQTPAGRTTWLYGAAYRERTVPQRLRRTPALAGQETAMTLLRTQLGNSLRSHRLSQRRTLRDVSGAARVSLGYLSEVERGQKEASSELLASICDALELELADLLAEVSDGMRSSGEGRRPAPARTEETPAPAAAPAGAEPALALVGSGQSARSVLRRRAVSLAA
jgi:transcriptional regulator with XRE-family HTH domain